MKITKRCLTDITKDRPMTFGALVTFVTEIETTLNSRPLTQTSEGINDFNLLSPNLFDLGTKSLYFIQDVIKDNYQNSLEGCRRAYKDVSETFHTGISTSVTNRSVIEESSA